MITDYNKYIEELDKIKNERTVLQHQDYVLSKKEIDTEKEFYSKVKDYVKSEFEKKLQKKGDHDYLLNDSIGIYFNKVAKTVINIMVAYYKDGNLTKFGNSSFSWRYTDKLTIDEFIDKVITGLEKIHKTREKAGLTRIAKKYNL